MRNGERGFTLVELVIAVAIAVVLLAASGAWMLSMRPGAMRAATNDFDSALSQARQLAGTTGSGATIAVLPRPNNMPGFILRVYSGRPTASNAVTVTTIRSVVSDAAVREATFGDPPFSLFFNSAGYPTGKASYPAVDAAGNATFAAVPMQPPCPVGGIVLTFRSPQGATQTRSLQCSTAPAGTVAPEVSPTPNLPQITPSAMVAHWTNDRGGALRFKVAEFGYTQPYTKADTACDAIATFASNPVTPSAAANADEPVAAFELYPIPGSPGLCTVAVADAYGQGVHASVQIMGDLQWQSAQSSLSMTVGDTQTLTFAKTFDAEALRLQAGGACAGIITASAASVTTAAQPSITPTTANLTITAAAAGSCTLLVGDQYGEPPISIPVNVKAKQPFATWPEMITLGDSNFAIAMHKVPRDYMALFNGLIGGAVADAAASAGCYAQATMSDGVTPDPLPAAIQSWAHSNGIYVDATGCFTNSAGTPVPATNNTVGGIIYEPGGNSQTFSSPASDTCSALEVGWFPGVTGVNAVRLIHASASTSTCTMDLNDGVSTQSATIGAGLVKISVIGLWVKETVKSGGPCAFISINNTFLCSGSASFTVLNYTSCIASAHLRNVGDTGPFPYTDSTNVYALNNPPTTRAGWDAFFSAWLAGLSNSSGNGDIVTVDALIDSGCP